jgi:hypothetical protein
MSMSQEKEAISKAPSGRPQRTPIGTRNVLTVKGKDPNYVYRVVNDVDDRIQQFKDAGYELVPDETVAVGDKRVNSATSTGSIKEVPVGKGQKAYIMRQKREFYEEDQATKLRKVAENERATKEKALDGTYGEYSVTRD